MQKKRKRNSHFGKLICILLFFFFTGTELFAHSGVLAGEKKLRVAKTKWFDIIYPERCQESAAILYEKADTVYEDVTAQYGLTPDIRLPVVITPAVDQFNAFWTSVPYNHITIYDTGATGSGDLSVFSETLLSTFRHELTHSVTYNMKNGFWRFTGKIFGDCVAPGMLSVTTGMAEGATVTSESAGGEGRLNDEYAKHYVKQAKIEGTFPSYHDVSGAADIPPGAAPYYFNGAFHQWLQEKYGMQAYAEFWYRVVNGKNLTIGGAFKKSFGVKIKAAWRKFEREYEVPSVAPDPVLAGLAEDFFDRSEREFSRMNEAGASYSSLTQAAGKRLVWMDGFGGRIFSAEASENPWDEEKISYRHLFSVRGLSSICLSNDGRFLTINYISDNAPGEKARVKLYDFENKSFYSVKESGIKGGTVVQSGDAWYLVGQKYFSQHYSITIQRLILDEKRQHVKGTAPLTEVKLEPETNPYAFAALPDGNFAFLKKERMNYSLCIMSSEGTLLKEYNFPKGMVVRSLSYNEAFYFSYAQKGNLPRLGCLTPADGQLHLSSQEISGGVFSPVYWEGRVVYIGEFFRQNRLLVLKDDFALNLEAEEAEKEISETAPAPAGDEIAAEPQSAIEDKPDLPSKEYNPFAYLTRGLLIPISIYDSNNSGATLGFLSNYKKIFLGATYITANPWTEGNSDLFILTGGWNVFSKSFGTSLIIRQGTATPLLQTQTEAKGEFNSEGWKQAGGNFTLSSSLELGNNSVISVSDTVMANFYRNTEFEYSEEIEKLLSNVVTLQFSTIRRDGPGRFARKGITLGVGYGRWYNEETYDGIAASARICIPRLIPFESKYGFTYNLPVSAEASLLPSSSIYGYAMLDEKKLEDPLGRPVFDAKFDAVLFSMDVQKALPGVTALYLNDFYISAGYAITGTAGSSTKYGFQTALLKEYFNAIADGEGYILDAVYIKSGLEFTPNIGLFASSAYKMNLFAIYSYTLNTPNKYEANEKFKLTLGFEM